jgi:haloalkane dehalogenase
MGSTRRSVLAGMGGLFPAAALAGDCKPKRRDRRKTRVATLDGLSLAYVEEGEGDPIVFLHGNPTSSHLWRNIIPYAAPFGRCLAPDLLGMGDSDKVPDAAESDYRIDRHLAHFDAFMARVGADRNVTLVLHDWGGPIGFDWARRNEERMRALIFMETFVWKMTPEAPPPVLDFFRFYRSAEGARAVLEENQFVEKVLLNQIRDQISDDEVELYRRPFATPGAARLPTLAFPREVPIGDDPAGTARLFDDYLAWLAATPLPKLWINAIPGALIPEPLKAIPRSWPNLREATVTGGHFIQDHAPHGIGRAIRDFMTA